MIDPDAIPEIDYSSETPGGGIAASMLAQLVGELPPAIFHYTSEKGLKGIIEKRVIWATDVRFLNDTTEFEHGRQACTLELTSGRYSGEFGSICANAAKWLDGVGFSFYTASFCSGSDIVPQWRGYGAQGAGYALGFKTSELAKLNEHFFVARVIYSEAEQRSGVRDILDGFALLWENEVKRTNARKEQIAQAVAISMLTALTVLAVSLKSEMFAYEQEWRIVQIESDPEQRDYPLEFRESIGLLVPYVSLPLTNSKLGVPLLPVHSVTIGPMARLEEARAGLTTYLASKGLDVPIKSSRAPLRYL